MSLSFREPGPTHLGSHHEDVRQSACDSVNLVLRGPPAWEASLGEGPARAALLHSGRAACRCNQLVVAAQNQCTDQSGAQRRLGCCLDGWSCMCAVFDPGIGLPLVTLELLCKQAAKPDPERWAQMRGALEALADHSPTMFTHSLRVGLYAHGLAINEGFADPVRFLCAGAGHDMGKIEIPTGVLDAADITPDQFEEIKQHSRAGFSHLLDIDLFAALVAGLHHSFQPNGYGIDLHSDSPVVLSPDEADNVIEAAKLVMICDFFDALTTRIERKPYTADARTPELQRRVMLEFFPDDTGRVDWLFAHILKPGTAPQFSEIRPRRREVARA